MQFLGRRASDTLDHQLHSSPGSSGTTHPVLTAQPAPESLGELANDPLRGWRANERLPSVARRPFVQMPRRIQTRRDLRDRIGILAQVGRLQDHRLKRWAIQRAPHGRLERVDHITTRADRFPHDIGQRRVMNVVKKR